MSAIVQLALDAQAARTTGDRRREAEALLALLSEVDVALEALASPETAEADGWRAIERVRGVVPE